MTGRKSPSPYICGPGSRGTVFTRWDWGGVKNSRIFLATGKFPGGSGIKFSCWSTEKTRSFGLPVANRMPGLVLPKRPGGFYISSFSPMTGRVFFIVETTRL